MIGVFSKSKSKSRSGITELHGGHPGFDPGSERTAINQDIEQQVIE